jgi:hypothetical protein
MMKLGEEKFMEILAILLSRTLKTGYIKQE